jgi:hypothetical protein
MTKKNFLQAGILQAMVFQMHLKSEEKFKKLDDTEDDLNTFLPVWLKKGDHVFPHVKTFLMESFAEFKRGGLKYLISEERSAGIARYVAAAMIIQLLI